MIDFKDVTFSDFKELVSFLKFGDEEKEYHNITKRLTRFIEGMNAYQSIMIDNTVKNILEEKYDDAEKIFDSFKETYPDIQFDPEGKLDLTDFNYFEISLQTCDMLFNQAKERIEGNRASDVDRQIYNAKTLEPLLKMTGRYEYPCHKVVYFKQNNLKPVTKEDLKNLEEEIKEIIPEENNIMGKFLEFIYHKKYEKCNVFVEL